MDKLEISHNATSIARGCWKKYYWTYDQGLVPRKKSTALTLGSIIHKAFELFYTGTFDSDVLQFILAEYKEELSKVDPFDREDLEISKYVAMGMWNYYPHKNLKEFDENIAEKEFNIPFGKLRNIRFKGRMDGLIKLNGKWWVRETKTSGLTPRQFAGRMGTSSQATGYVYAAKRLGYDVQGVMYDVIKKPLIRKGVFDTVDTYGHRIMDDYMKDGALNHNDRKFYSRHFIYRSPLELEQYIQDTEALIRDIRRHKRKGEWYRNMDQCWNFNTLCPFSKICFADKPDQLTLELYYEKKSNTKASEVTSDVPGKENISK